MTRENSIQSWAIAWLNQQPHTVARNCGADASGHVEGDPDVYGCVNGQMFVMEFKNAEGKLSKAQEYRLEQWKNAGAHAFVLRDRDAVRKAWCEMSSGLVLVDSW